MRAGVNSEELKAAHAEVRKRTLIGKMLNMSGVEAGGYDGEAYREEFIRNTDFRKFDETLRMVLDLSDEESQHLESWLETQFNAGVLAFGIHRSRAAIATCMVRSYKGDHVHFIDGEDGGYALAAKGLKAQLNAVATRAL
jgi:hypothetical protein